MIRLILQLGNETLREKSSPADNLHGKDLENLIEDLSDTLQDAKKRFSYGRGIAAPQIGVLKRVVFINMLDFKSALINPTVMKASDKKFEVWDSCFSFNLTFFVLVDRHYSVEVGYLDQEGKKHVTYVQAMLSELLQHEIDHLDGILAIDRMKDTRMMMRSEWEKSTDSWRGVRDSNPRGRLGPQA